ncbi:MAG TPA: hypothetical protein VGB77_07465 [Abditibacteriaceae bacterium]
MKNNIRQNVALLACGAAFGLTVGTQSVEAQRDRQDRRDQRGERRERLQNATPEQLQQLQQQRQQNMTPEARAQMEQRMQQFRQQREQERWNWVREALSAAGFGDQGLQDAVIEMMKSETTGTESLREMERQLAAKLVDPAFQPEAFPAELKAFRDAVAKYQEDKATALKQFDEKHKYSTQPKLETVLTVLGVLGPETTTLGGLGQVFPDSPFGRGGFGRGGQGGNRGGGGGGN